MKKPKNVGQSPLFFPHIFTCELIRNISPKQDNSGTGCTCVYLDLFCDIPEFILQQIIDDFIGRKLGLSQIIKTKQVFMVCDWKEDTSVEEGERKVIATRFIISYL